ncbi:hypothetical protein QQ045_012570 [Rhodiola kirilowii]
MQISVDLQMRHGTKKLHKDGITVLIQHMLCHHEGVNKKQKPKDSLLKTKKETRGRKTTRCGCLAKIRVRLVDGGKYEVFVFEEKHNHRLATELGKQFLRNNRQLSLEHQHFIVAGRNINIGATKAHRIVSKIFEGLISNENIDSYTWLLTCFKNLLSEQPNIIITDQDPAMKAAVAQVFDRSYHRFCMWHIAEKLKAKVGPLCNVNDFLKKIGSVIWGHHNEPSDFEDGWHNVIREYKVENNTWLADMFDKRSSWIPVYSKHVLMSNLLRTTSRSESENSFFGRYIHHYMTFVEFYLGFRTAMKEQRKTRIQLDYENDTTSPPVQCPLKIARHASEIFIHKFFKETEIEIEAGVYKCSIEEVSFVISTSNAVCSCNKFQSYGIICRHISCFELKCGGQNTQMSYHEKMVQGSIKFD